MEQWCELGDVAYLQGVIWGGTAVGSGGGVGVFAEGAIRDAEMEHSQPGLRGEESLRFASLSSAFSVLKFSVTHPHPQFDLYIVGLKSAFSGLRDRSSWQRA